MYFVTLEGLTAEKRVRSVATKVRRRASNSRNDQYRVIISEKTNQASNSKNNQYRVIISGKKQMNEEWIVFQQDNKDVFFQTWAKTLFLTQSEKVCCRSCDFVTARDFS